MHNKHSFLAAVFGVAVLLSSGCDGDDGSKNDEVGDGDGDGDETGDGDGDPSSGDGDGNPDTGDDKGTDFGSDDEGQLEGCAVHESADDCLAEAGCSPVYGKPLIDTGKGEWCTMSSDEYIGCVSSSVLCPGFDKTLCDGDQYWRTSACVPDNVEVCDAPGEITGACGDGWI